MSDSPTPLKTTPLHGLHIELGAKMVPFGGYDMPVNYPTGILAEHLHTRAAAGLFDVSHMGLIRLTGKGGAKPAAALERLAPADIQSLPIGGIREKVLAARRAGLTTVILPHRNEGDLEDLPEEVRDAMTIHLAQDVTQVLDWALESSVAVHTPVHAAVHTAVHTAA